jgi:hypothetical protein
VSSGWQGTTLDYSKLPLLLPLAEPTLGLFL